MNLRVSLLLCLTACGPSIDTVVTAADGNAVLTVPAAATPSPERISVRVLDDDLYEQHSRVYRFAPSGTHFDVPVTLRIRGSAPDVIAVFLDDRWVPLPTRAPEAGWLEADLEHFSDYAVVPPDAPEGPRVHALNGLWDDSGHEARVDAMGGAISAHYTQPYVCDHRDGTGQSDQTDLDFDGTLSGDTVTGQTSVCSFGANNPGGVGIKAVDMTLTASADDITLSGTWTDGSGSDHAMELTRLGCRIKTPQDFGLPDGNEQRSDYNATRAYRKDGSVDTVPDTYVKNDETDLDVRTHHGIDYTSRDATGSPAPLDFTAAVSGTVHLHAGSAWNTIDVVLPNGDVVQYLHASSIAVAEGATVGPGTVLGKTGDTGAAALHLHVQAKDAAGHWMNPNCAE